MSNEWNADSLKARTIISDNIVSTSGEKYVISSTNNSHHVGEQWISMDGTIPFGGVPFLGQQVSTEVYKELYNWAAENDRLISEEEWQTKYTAQNGNVPFYAYGDDGSEGSPANWSSEELDISILEGATYVYIDFDYYNGDGNVEGDDLFDNFTYTLEIPAGADTSNAESMQAGLNELVNEFNNIENLPIIIEKTGEDLSSFGFTAHFKEIGQLRDYNTIKICVVKGGEEIIAEGELTNEIPPTPATQFRMPLYRGYLKAQTVAGSYIAEGLPNITGSFTSQYTISQTNGSTSNGAIVTPNNTSTGKYGSTDASETWGRGFNFDASKSNAIYGKSSHVTPETNTMLIGVYAFNEITNPAVVNAEEYRQAIANNEVVVNDCVVKVEENEATLLKNCPVGCVMMYAKSATPEGWLTCNGSTVSRTTYSGLFNVIGTTFGEGDGSTTFALPNLTDKFAMGNNTVGTTKAAGLPNITGTLSKMSLNSVTPTASGAFSAAADSSSGYGYAGYTHEFKKISFAAKSSNSIYGASSTVQPPALTLRYIIKY